MLSAPFALFKLLRSETTRLLLAGFVLGGVAMASMPNAIAVAEALR